MPNNNKNRSDARKNKSQRSWTKRQERKAANVKAAESAFNANQSYRAKGLPTPYEQRQRDRAAAKRAAHE